MSDDTQQSEHYITFTWQSPSHFLRLAASAPNSSRAEADRENMLFMVLRINRKRLATYVYF